MKFYNIVLFLSVIMFTCKEQGSKPEKAEDKLSAESTISQDSSHKNGIEKKGQVTSKLNEESGNPKFYREGRIKEYSFKTSPLKRDYILMSDPSMSDSLKIEKFFVNDSLKKEFYLKTDTSFCYRFVNYNLIFEDDRIRAFTAFCNYDYFKNIFLITTSIKNGSLVDSKVIASIMGDAGDLTEISTSFMDSISFKITTNSKQLTENDNFKTLSSDTKEFKITPSGEINQM